MPGKVYKEGLRKWIVVCHIFWTNSNGIALKKKNTNVGRNFYNVDIFKKKNNFFLKSIL